MLFSMLANLAEDRQAAARGASDEVAEALERLAAEGVGTEQAAALLDRALIVPVLTAHPTEVMRKSMLDHRNRIAELMRLRDLGRAETREGDVIEEAIQRQIALLWQTRPLRRERLYVADEVEIALAYLRDMLLPVLPALYARWERLLAHRPRSFLRLGSWIGGDRDGNPNVTADSLRLALRRASQTVLEAYLDQLHAVGADLSVSTELTTPTEAVAALAERSGDVNPARRDEPYRRAITGMYARLAASFERITGSIAPRPPSVAGAPYESAEQFRADLVAIAHSLGAAGEGLLATGGALGRLIRAVETCGFHLATLDLRQNADVHARVVADLLKVAGVEPDYLALDEASRVSLLTRELASERPLASAFAAYADETASELAIVHAAAEAHATLRARLDHRLHRVQVRERLRPARGQRPAQGSGALSAAACGGRADHGGAAVRDDRRPGGCASHHAGVAVDEGGHRGRAIARLSGGDGRLLRLQQGRRLPDLGVEPASGHPGAGARVRRSARRDADLSRPRRRRRPRRRIVVRRDSCAAGRDGAGPHSHHRAGRSHCRQVRHPRECGRQPGRDDGGDAAGVSRGDGGVGLGVGPLRGGHGDVVARRVPVRIAASSTRPRGSPPCSTR